MPIKVDLVVQTVTGAEESSSSSVYVFNHSKPRGNINFVVTDAAGRNIGVQIPVTFIPVDLSMYCVKSDLLRTPNFRRLATMGVFDIIESSSAEAMLKDPKARAEFNRIHDVIARDEAVFQAPVSDSINAEPPKSENEISTFIQNMVLRATSEPLEGLISELEGKLDTFSVKDIEYLQENTANVALKEWCTEAIGVMK
jgi:hypothetical protein